jgi:hypothetical protein
MLSHIVVEPLTSTGTVSFDFKVAILTANNPGALRGVRSSEQHLALRDACLIRGVW